MRKVPSQVVVVTLATPNEPYPHLGITCSSFTSVSLTPSIISFSVREPSRCAKLFSASPNQEFAVHILSSNQAGHSAAFSSPLTQHVFKTFEHDVDEKSGLVVMRGSLGVLMCQAVANVTVGDHTAWFGKVTRIIDANAEGDPLLYYGGAYRTVAKEDCSFCNGTPEH
ncbi:flavin reductase domain-containing FMN-binding protein [Powellomyces hirtus]|nr:flavin reductase domain-containing FMN-binding protein [Powellomyces hirtus]